MVNQEAQLPQQQQRRQGRGGQRRPQPYCPSAPPNQPWVHPQAEN